MTWPDGHYTGIRPRHERNKIKRFFHDLAKKPFRLSCQFPQTPECQGQVIGSHSIQKGGAAKVLSDRSNHVIRLEAHFTTHEAPRAVAKKVGINAASLFFALCARHDEALFAPIEKAPIDPQNKQHLFLLAYRGFLREYYAKCKQVSHYEQIQAFLKIDHGAHPSARRHADILLAATKSGLRRLESTKMRFEAGLLNGSWDTEFHYWAATLPLSATVAASCCFTPDFDFAGRRVNAWFDEVRLLNAVSITICPINEETLVSTCIPMDYCAELLTFYTTWESASGVELEMILSDLLLRYCENIAIAPSHWRSLPPKRQEAIVEFFNATLFEKDVPFPGRAANLFS